MTDTPRAHTSVSISGTPLTVDCTGNGAHTPFVAIRYGDFAFHLMSAADAFELSRAADRAYALLTAREPEVVPAEEEG